MRIRWNRSIRCIWIARKFPACKRLLRPIHNVGRLRAARSAGYIPGVLVMYQMNNDTNPDESGLSVGSNAATIEIYERIFNQQHDSPAGEGLIGIRKEFTNDGLGAPVALTGNVDLSYHIARYLFFYGEAGFTQSSTPAWRTMLWWTTPIQREP